MNPHLTGEEITKNFAKKPGTVALALNSALKP